MKVVILAGGFGTRITEESQFKPKPTTYAIDSDASFAAENNTDYGGK